MGGRIEKSNGQSGKARLNLLLALLLLGVAVTLMAFLENASAEIIGGIVGGFIVLSAASLLYKFRTFKISFISPTERLTAEHKRECAVVRTDVGTSVFCVCIKPRIGVELEEYGFAFFERGKLPWLVGRRRSTEDIEIIQMRHLDIRYRRWNDTVLTNIDNEGCYTDEPMVTLAGGSRAYYELTVKIARSLKPWEGVLRFKLFYHRDGNPETKFIRTKFLIRSPDKNRPIRSLFKKVLKCEPTPLISGKEGAQTELTDYEF